MAHSSTARAWARGGTVFGATMMLIIGLYQTFMGIAAIVQNDFFVVGPNYAYEVDTTAWGWIHLGIGVLALLAGLFLFTGAMWARVLGIALAALSAVANFFFLPYYPVWSLLVIALDIFVIWALASVSMRGYWSGGPETGARAGEVPQHTGYQSAGGGTAQPGMSQAGMTQGGMTQGERWPSTNPPSERTERAMSDRKDTMSDRQDQAARQADQARQAGQARTTPPPQ